MPPEEGDDDAAVGPRCSCRYLGADERNDDLCELGFNLHAIEQGGAP